jgi:iron complex transport system substrate-binding protein
LTINPERIVSLAPSNTEILFAIGAGERVVGVTDYCNYPPNVPKLVENDFITSIGGYCNPSIDLIKSLKPDLILASKYYPSENRRKRCGYTCRKITERLRRLGFNILTLAPKSVDDILKNIVLIGKATGNNAEAELLTSNLRKKIDIITIKLKNVTNNPKVYFEAWSDPFMAAGSGNWISDLIKLAGGLNVFKTSTVQWLIISSKEIIELDPNIMIFPYIEDIQRFWGNFDEVKKRPEWIKIDAVRNNRLYEIQRDIISRPGPRIVEALEMMAKIVHPEILSN